MPQESDGSMIAMIVWMFWFYWFVYDWLARLANGAIEDVAKQERKDSLAASSQASQPPIETLPIPPWLTAMVVEIHRHNPRFDLVQFLDNAGSAFETITLAFATGDKPMLERLLSDAAYVAFTQAISAREARGETQEILFVTIAPVKPVHGVVTQERVELTVRIESELFDLRRDRHGRFTGDRTCKHSADLWTFAWSFASPPTDWRLLKTDVPHTLARDTRADIKTAQIAAS